MVVADDLEPLVHDDDTCAGPSCCDRVQGAKLSHKLIGRPKVVVIAEGYPRRRGARDAGVARGRHELRLLVMYDLDTSVFRSKPVQPGAGPVGRTIVDDDHLERDADLLQDRAD